MVDFRAASGRNMTVDTDLPQKWRGRDVWLAVCIFAVGMAVRFPVLYYPGHSLDAGAFAIWAFRMHDGKLADAYIIVGKDGSRKIGANYPPGYLYVLALDAGLCRMATGVNLRELSQRAEKGISVARESVIIQALLRLPAVLADAVTGVVLYCLLRRIGAITAFLIGLLYVLQPGVIYNSARWGQVDAFHTLFMVLSLEMGLRRRYGWMSAFAATALAFKLQAIVIAPVWGLYLLLGPDRGLVRSVPASFVESVREALSFGRMVRVVTCMGVAVLVLAAFCLPFVLQGAGDGLYKAYFDAVGYYPVVTANAFNLWGLLCPLYTREPTGWMRDSRLFAGVSLHTLGMLLLAASLCVVAVRSMRSPGAPESIRWCAVVLCMVFFVFPTQIHERYLHPVLAILAWAYVPRVWWWALWLTLGGVYWLNLLWALPFDPRWPLADIVNPVSVWQVGDWPPSQRYGLMITVLTLAMLAMPLGLWRRQSAEGVA